MPELDTERHMEAEQVRLRLREIQGTIYGLRRSVEGVEACVTGPGKGPDQAPRTGWRPFPAFGRWGGYDQTTWFRARVVTPGEMAGQRLVVLARPGGESLAYVQGKPFQGLDENRDELILTEQARAGERFDLLLESVPSTRFDTWHVFQYLDVAVMDPLAWDCYWDGMVLLEVLRVLPADYAPTRRLLALLTESVRLVDLRHVGQPAYRASLERARRHLRAGLKEFESSTGMGALVLSGHAHIDTAWLWPLRETKRKCARTFSTVLNLMERYPEFHFSCSQPVQYEWMKTHYPEIYGRIRERVREGRWECCGAPWVEPDCNVPSGESLVRQFVYGNRFLQREFGVRSHIAWQPDAFGYSWQLPQIMRKCGLDAFVTTKISWGRFTEFPYSLFQWEGADGTRILGLMPPLNYNGNPVPRDVVAHWNQFKQKERVEELPFSIGWGDGGGGPTMAMIEHGRRLGNVVGIPRCSFGRNQDTIRRMMAQCRVETLPVWNDELYLEYHRGCQTTQARTKRNNRMCERALRDAEFVAALSWLAGGPDGRVELREAWKVVLTNQFHDILPGSSITEVYRQADEDYGRARDLIGGVMEEALGHLHGLVDTRGRGTAVVVGNTLSWPRTDVARVEMALPEGAFSVVRPDGTTAPHQVVDGGLLFEVEALPPMGYAVYHVAPGGAAGRAPRVVKATRRTMENDYFRVSLDRNGCLTRVYDKLEEREVLEEGRKGNDLQLFEDRPHCADAWDIDHNYEETPLPIGAAESVEVVEEGPVRAVVRVVRRTERSVITQDITLYASLPRIDFVTRVDWHEKKALLKVAFPVAVRSSLATYEIQFGAIQRATHRNTAHDRGRFEVTGHRWSDLSEAGYGVSLLNDCKYGHDTHGNVLRLSLLRAPVDPDPTADEGEHEFTYSLYPHADDWRNGTVRQGLELNVPPVVRVAESHGGGVPAAGSFVAVDAEHVVLDTVKLAEDSDALVFRLYEAHGQRGPVEVTFGHAPVSVAECNLMEEEDVPVALSGHALRFDVKPYEIRTFKVRFR